MPNKYRRIILATLLLLMIKALLSVYYFRHLNENVSTLNVSLRDSPQKWVQVLGAADAGAYLEAALQFSENGRLEAFCSQCKPPQMAPFYFWAPGTPFSQGIILKLFGKADMKAIFIYVAIVEALTALGSLLILCLLTSNFFAILVGVLFISLDFPLATYYFGSNELLIGRAQEPLLSSSEPLALLFFVYSFLFIFLALAKFWNENDGPSVRLFSLFGTAGLLIGFSSLVRDSSVQFAYFFAVAFILLVLIRRRKKLKPALLYALLLVLGTLAVRYPVERWNRKRIGIAVVSTSGVGGIWRYGIWGDYSTSDPVNKRWIENSGLGFGSFLEPDVAAKLREKYERGERGTDSIAKKEFFLALVRDPLKALWFKLRRLPVLFMDADIWPRAQLWPMSYYCLILYFFLLMHFVRSLWWREWPREIFYLYPTFLLLASLLIHFEFRYSFPAMLVLQVLPAYEISRWVERYRALASSG